MQIQITVRHFDARPELKEYASDKLGKLERFYNGITTARVVLSEDGTPSKGKSAEIFLHVYRQTLTAQDEASTHEEAIDQCVARLRRQLMRYKSKLRATNKHYQR